MEFKDESQKKFQMKANFSSKSVCDLGKSGISCKCSLFMETRCQFNQHFTYNCFVQKLFEHFQLKILIKFVLYWRNEMSRKAALKMLVKLTTEY
jgi:hypothetical protein